MKSFTQRGQKVLDFVSDYLPKQKNQCPAHQLDHILSVWKTGIDIGKQENADLEILEPALLLHDIKKPVGDKGAAHHAVLSSNFAKEVLPNFNFSSEEIKKICHAILCHSTSQTFNLERSLEGKIVYDADKLNAVGESGIKRAIKVGKSRGWSLKETAEWYKNKINYVLEKEMLSTETVKMKVIELANESLEWCEEQLKKT